jgi:glucose/arabinose dehydrogenase
MKKLLSSALHLYLLAAAATTLTAQNGLQPHTLAYAPGKQITLNLPPGFDISVAATGIPRARFFARSPDGRIFITSMYNLADNTRGAIYILEGWDASARRFTRITPYLQHLRNPNNVAFYTDPAGQSWIYVPLTDRLLRYKYNAGDSAPSTTPQVLLRFPDYGLDYKYGGWHLTRTVAVATLHGRTRVYITSGSSCNYCQELEAERAALVAIDPDGGHPQLLAHGLRNAVDLRFVPEVDGGALFATNMGDDHLGDKLPEDTFFELDANNNPGPIAQASVPNYGWPTCYFAHGKPALDTTPLPTNPGPGDHDAAPRPAAGNSDSAYGKQASGASAGTNLAAQHHAQTGLPNLGPVPAPLTSCNNVPAAYTTFAAHSSPLGLAYFAADNGALHNSFLVALHGSGHTRIGTGYRLARFTDSDRTPQDFLTGFLTHTGTKPVVHGRPCGLMRVDSDTFLLTDDKLGLVYFISAKH